MAEPRKKNGATVVVSRTQRDRMKSVNDIYAQRDRIVRGSQGNPARINLAGQIANRYARNIYDTPEYAFDRLPIQQRVNEAVAEARRRGYTTAAQANADEELVRRYGRFAGDFFNQGIARAILPGSMSRAYSRSVYARNRR